MLQGTNYSNITNLNMDEMCSGDNFFLNKKKMVILTMFLITSFALLFLFVWYMVPNYNDDFTTRLVFSIILPGVTLIIFFVIVSLLSWFALLIIRCFKTMKKNKEFQNDFENYENIFTRMNDDSQ